MGEVIHINAWMLAVGAFVITTLLTIIARFLWRMVEQFDHLTTSVSGLNDTMNKIHADLKVDITRLETRDESQNREIEKFHQIWDRVRKAENDITEIRATSCSCRAAH